MNTYRLRDINFLLFFVAVILILLLVYQIFKPLDLPEMVGRAPVEKAESFPSLNIEKISAWNDWNYDSMVEMNLFSSERKPPEERSKTVSEENGEGSVAYEGYELIGTVLSDEERSFALIRKGGARGETDAYRLRDDVGGMVVQEILYDRVVLSKSGKEVVLLLEPREEEKKANRPMQSQVNRRNNPPESKQNRNQSWSSLERLERERKDK